MEHSNGDRLLHAELTEKTIGAFYVVQRELGFGFLESVYEAALAITLRNLGLDVRQQAPIDVWFHGRRIGLFRADLVVEELVIVELKALRQLAPQHEAQLLNALRASNIEVGFLVNFGPKLSFKRMVYDNSRKRVCGIPCSSAAG